MRSSRAAPRHEAGTWESSLALLAALLCGTLACGPVRTLETYRCPDGGTALNWHNFGAAFLDRRCQGCHATDAVERQGAPSGYTFDSPKDVRRWRVRIFERAAAENDTMPPGPDDPPLSERMKLAEWLACGSL